jgi:hypothetical protein
VVSTADVVVCSVPTVDFARGTPCALPTYSSRRLPDHRESARASGAEREIDQHPAFHLVSPGLLPRDDVTTTLCCSFSFLLSGRAAGPKDPKDDDRRGKLVSKGNERIFDGWPMDC